MPVGRGSTERHRSPRQKRAVWINRFGSKDMVDRYYERRSARMKPRPRKVTA